MKRVVVRLAGRRSYPILIGKDILPKLGSWIRRQGVEPCRAIVVSQKQIAVYYEAPVRSALAAEGFESSFFITPPAKSSEAAKSYPVFLKLIRKLVEASAGNRSVMLVALGGGVIGDLTGFAASVYRRGVPYVQVPTTLTAQVDSAIGGKTGIDLPQGKNLLGSVYQPLAVFSDVGVLNSLPERHWSDGFAEVVKYGVIESPGLFHLLEKKEVAAIRTRALEGVIEACAKIKAKVVTQDEEDKKGVRIVLNFGHTAGHAIEAASRFSRQYTHGEAVSIGMLVACDIAGKLGVLKDPDLPARLERVLMKFSLPVFYKGLRAENILRAIGLDKKSDRGANRFVLPVSFGKTSVVRDVPSAVIAEALGRRQG